MWNIVPLGRQIFLHTNTEGRELGSESKKGKTSSATSWKPRWIQSAMVIKLPLPLEHTILFGRPSKHRLAVVGHDVKFGRERETSRCLPSLGSMLEAATLDLGYSLGSVAVISPSCDAFLRLKSMLVNCFHWVISSDKIVVN